MSLQLIEFFYNPDTGQLSNDEGNPVSQDGLPLIYISQQDVVFAFKFERAGGIPATDLFLNDDTFQFNCDDDFDQTSPLAMQTLDAGFNIAADFPTLNVTGGRICYRLDADTNELATILGTEEETTLNAEIQVFPVSITKPKQIFSFKLLARNVVNNNSTPPTGSTSNFFTKAQTTSLLADKENKQTTPATNKDATVAAVHDVFTVAASKDSTAIKGLVKTVSITGSATLPTIQWKTDGGIILHGPVLMSADEGLVNGLMRFTFGNDEVLPAGTIVQAEITGAGNSTTHLLDFRYNGFKEDV